MAANTLPMPRFPCCSCSAPLLARADQKGMGRLSGVFRVRFGRGDAVFASSARELPGGLLATMDLRAVSHRYPWTCWLLPPEGTAGNRQARNCASKSPLRSMPR